MEKRLQLRSAVIADLELTLEWVNNPEIRRYSFNKDYVEFERHNNWFKEKIASKNTLYFIALFNSIEVGSFRADKINKEVVVSFLLDPKFQGLGLGHLLLASGVSEIMSKWKSISVIGFVQPENITSAKLFEGLGFKKIEAAESLKFLLEL